MKTLQNNFTTPEQSKWLLELGVPADSADCYFYDWDLKKTNDHHRGGSPQIFDWFQRDIEKFKKRKCIKVHPCWSVGRLFEIIKICSDVPIDWTGGLNEEREVLEVVEDTLYALYLGKHMDFSKLEE